jgi:hypothetical protein
MDEVEKDRSAWEKNLEVLKTRFSKLAKIIEQAGKNAEPLYEYRLEAATNSSPTLLIEGRYVHSRIKPEDEAGRIAKSLPKDSPAIIVLGPGLAYSAEAAALAFPDKPLVLVERDAAILCRALESRNLVRLLSHPLLAILPGAEPAALKEALEGLGVAPDKEHLPALIRNPTLGRFYQGYYTEVEAALHAWVNARLVNKATLERFGERWKKNRLANAKLQLPRLDSLLRRQPLKAGKPVLLVAAGPSLDEAAGALASLSKKCCTVAVNTALHFLQRLGIEPDYALIGDPQYVVIQHIARVNMPQTILLAEDDVYPACLRAGRFKEIYLYSSAGAARGESRQGPSQDMLHSGGSIATAAWDFARLLGARTVYIAGLDLAYPQGRTHFKGAAFEKNALNSATRTAPPETASFHALREGGRLMTEALGGGQVATDRRLALYASWFSQSFKAHPEIKNYSLTGAGIKIKGLISMKLCDIL